jgi:capsular polysaccharide biosynthesis protein
VLADRGGTERRSVSGAEMSDEHSRSASKRKFARLTSLFGPLRVRQALVCVVASLVAGLLAYEIGHSLTATYQSSGTIRIALASEGGTNDPDVLATNDLATQYAQLVTSTTVQALTAQRLRVPVADLNGELRGSTVAAQNLLQVTASAGTPGLAQSRAAAATTVMKSYLASLSTRVGQQYLNALANGLAELRAQRGRPRGTTAAIVQAKAQAIASGVRDAAGSVPQFEIVDAQGDPTETTPKPKLYAILAFVVVLIISGRLAFVMNRSEPNTRAG